MSILTKLFGKSKKSTEEPSEDEPLIPVPIPALGVLLLNLEKNKGAPLTQEEVCKIRDEAVCIMLPLSKKLEMDSSRGYEDVNPENVWLDWLDFKEGSQGVKP